MIFVAIMRFDMAVPPEFIPRVVETVGGAGAGPPSTHDFSHGT